MSSEIAILSANCAAFKAVDLADYVDTCFTTCSAYAQAAYCSLLLGKLDNATEVHTIIITDSDEEIILDLVILSYIFDIFWRIQLFKVANNSMIEHDTEMSSLELAIVKIRMANYLAAIGSIGQARHYAEDAKYIWLACVVLNKLFTRYLFLESLAAQTCIRRGAFT